MKTKNAPAVLAPEADEGTFEAVVSVFGNKDLVGDIVMPGAFAKSLDHWKSSGDPIPIYWSHRMDDPTYNIGAVEHAEELAGGDQRIPEWANDAVKAGGGLLVKGRLDDFGLGKHVSHLMKSRRVKQFSFSYDVVSETKSKSGDANELHELWLHEVGPTPLGANPMTELIAAKKQPDPPPEPDTTTSPEAKASGLFSCRARIDIARLFTYAD
ncbi:MAG: HK97 family phage prohead protease [Propionibacteriaceae bacterium]